MYQLSILIPARNEKYLSKTIEDIFEHAESDIEIIIGLDGYKPDDELKRLNDKFSSLEVDYSTEVKGQRAVTNYLASRSRSKFLFKCDAHCSFSQGFDVKMMKEMDDRTIMAPVMLPLDANKWEPAANLPVSWFGFDSNLVTQIDRSRQNYELINESMTLHGSAWMIDRETYWKWNICDETLGSWGYQAFELGYKAFMNGGKCVVNKGCFYSHLERRKEPDFPYQRDMEKIKATRDEVLKRYRDSRLIPIIEKWGYPFDWTEEKVKQLPKYERN